MVTRGTFGWWVRMEALRLLLQQRTTNLAGFGGLWRIGPSELMDSATGAWAFGLDPMLRGPGSDVAQSVKCAPAALRETAALELLTSFTVPVGSPPTMNADAPLVLPCMGYRSSRVAFGSCKADSYLPGCVGGTQLPLPLGDQTEPGPKSTCGITPMPFEGHSGGRPCGLRPE